MKFAFTNASVKKALEGKPRGSLIWDETQRNLGAYATGNGISLFCQFRVGRIAKKKVLGRLGELSIQAARTMTAEYVVAGHHGKDVLADEKRARQKALTLADAYAAYLEALMRRGASAGTLQLYDCNWRLRLTRHGARPLASFSRGELRDMHNGWKKYGVTAANNTGRMLRSVLNHSIRKMDADIQLNPASAIEFFAQRNRRPMLSLAELPRWAEALGQLSANCRAFWLLVLFTGLRRNDAARIRLSDIREEVLHRPKPKGSRAFDFPISRQLRAIIDRAIEAKAMISPESDWLFPATRGDGPYTGANVDAVRGVGCHALRRSFASFCIQSGVDLIYTKSLLNHTTTGDVSMNSYIQLDPLKRLEAAQRVSDFIETRLMGLFSERVEPLPLLEFEGAGDEDELAA